MKVGFVLLVAAAQAQHYRSKPRAQTCAGENDPNFKDKNNNKCSYYKNPQECFDKTKTWSEADKINLLFHCRGSCDTCEAKMCEDRNDLLTGIAGDPKAKCSYIMNGVGHQMCGTNLAKLSPDFKPLESFDISLGDFCPGTCYGSRCADCSQHSDCKDYEYCDMRGTCSNDYMCCEYNDGIDGTCNKMTCDDFNMDTYMDEMPEVSCASDDECHNGEYCHHKDNICTTCNECENAFASPLGYDQKCHDRCRDWCNDQVMKDEQAFDGAACFQGNDEFGRCMTCGYVEDGSTLSNEPSKCITCEPGYAIDLRDADLDSDCTGYCVKEDELSTWGIGRYPCKPRAKCIADGFRIDRTLLVILVVGIVVGSLCGFLLLCVLPICICCCCCCCCRKKKPAEQSKPQQIIMPAVQMAAPVQQMAAPVALPPGWTVARDPATGRTYYCNAATQQTSWTHPVTGQ